MGRKPSQTSHVGATSAKIGVNTAKESHLHWFCKLGMCHIRFYGLVMNFRLGNKSRDQRLTYSLGQWVNEAHVFSAKPTRRGDCLGSCSQFWQTMGRFVSHEPRALIFPTRRQAPATLPISKINNSGVAVRVAGFSLSRLQSRRRGRKARSRRHRRLGT